MAMGGTRSVLRRMAVAAAALGTVIGALVGAAPASADPGVNYIDNPGFEAGYLGQWRCAPASSANPVVTSPVHSGSYALRGARVWGGYTECWYTTYLPSNTWYELGAAVRGNLVEVGVRGQTITPQSVRGGNAGEFVGLYTSFYGADAGVSPVTVYVRGFAGYGEFHADDFTLRQIPG